MSASAPAGRHPHPRRSFSDLFVPSDKVASTMMLRLLTLAGAIAVASLLQAAPAEAAPLCQSALLTGLIYQPVGPQCVPYSGGTTCTTQHVTVGTLAELYATACVPSVLG
jgi:hypothetical protein